MHALQEQQTNHLVSSLSQPLHVCFTGDLMSGIPDWGYGQLNIHGSQLIGSPEQPPASHDKHQLALLTGHLPPYQQHNEDDMCGCEWDLSNNSCH